MSETEKPKRPPTYFTVPAGTREAECKSCHATIYFVTTPKGKQMPVDCEPEGCYEPSILAEMAGDPDFDGKGVSHFGTCPTAAQHRKARS